jgi:actin-related protein 8, plant
MAMLLRKVWGSVLARTAPPRGRCAPPVEYHGTLSLGALDAVPTDVLVQILRLLGPVDAARCSAVCRAWRILASDNGLWAFFLRVGPEPWDLVVFAETHLAADPASRPRCVPCRPLSSAVLKIRPAIGTVPKIAVPSVGCSTIARSS